MHKYKGFSPDSFPCVRCGGTVCVDTIHRVIIIDVGVESEL